MPTIVTVGTEDDDNEEFKDDTHPNNQHLENTICNEAQGDLSEVIDIGSSKEEEVIINGQQHDDEDGKSDFIKNRIENSVGGIYGIENANIEDEDALDREIMEMRKSATGIIDDLEGLIDRGDHFQRTEYLNFTSTEFNNQLSIPGINNLHRKVTWKSANQGPESGEKSNDNGPTTKTSARAGGIRIELPLLANNNNNNYGQGHVEPQFDNVEEIIDDNIIDNDALLLTSDSFDLDSRASSSLSSDSNQHGCSPQLHEQDPEALAKTIEDETFRRYLKISPEERERLKNREAELPVKFDDFIAIHGFSVENQRLKNEKRNDHIHDSIAFIENQHFSYHSYEMFSESSSDEKHQSSNNNNNPQSKNVMEKSSLTKKNKKRRKKKNEDVVDMDHAHKALTQEQVNAQRKLNKQKREEQKKRHIKREKNVIKLERQSKKSQEMYEKAERRCKIFSEWIENQGIITEDVTNLIPRVSEKEVEDSNEVEPEVPTNNAFFITDATTTENYIEKRRQKEKQKSLFAIPRTFDPGKYDRKNSNLYGSVALLDQPVKFGQASDRDGSSSFRMPSISRSNAKSVGSLTFWHKGGGKRPAVREITSLTTNRDVGNLKSVGIGREHLPKIV